MKCPVDDRELVMTERSGIEIDYCPSCRGVWLDRGELDKIIERSAEATARDRSPDRDDDRKKYDDREKYDDRKKYDDDDRGIFGRPKKKKESFLSELFEFGG